MTPRRGLFRKYVLVLVALVSGALLTSGAVEVYFTYQESTEALAALQGEKALTAATRIEQFAREIEQQLVWATHPQLVTGPEALDQRSIDYYRLLRHVPAITELSQLDGAGREELRISRLAMNVVGGGADFSGDPRFTEARRGRTYFSPVYFRKESEPYMRVAMPAGRGVTVAEVNLKFIWDVVSQMTVGRSGHTYVVDGRGHLIAHPDISLVLRKSDVSGLEQVRAAIAAPGEAGGQAAMVARDLQGHQVLAAHAPVPAVGWSVIVEQPLSEAFAPLRASMARTGGLVLAGVALSLVAGLALARRMVRPIRALETGAARIGAGDLGHRIEVRTGDELEALAAQFNAMTARLQESYTSLERKVEERTRDLTESLGQQTATAEILRVISGSPTDTRPVFSTIVASTARLCDANLAVLFLYDGEVLTAAAHHNASVEFAEYLERSRLRPSQETATRRAALERRTVHVHDLRTDATFAPPPVHEREGVRTILSVPMLREERLVGVLTVWRREVRPFTDRQVALLQTFADQAVIAVENVRLFTELQERTRELARTVQELTALGEVGRAVSATLDLDAVLGAVVTRASQLAGADGCSIYEYDEDLAAFTIRATSVAGELLDAQRQVRIAHGEGAVGRLAVTREPIQIPDISPDGAYQGPLRDALLRLGYRAVLAVPLVREDRIIGGLVVTRKTPGAFRPETVELLRTFATHAVLAIQNARLFREVEDKSRQLEAANRHKSEFLANMSHELRTPLNAVIGFSEVLLERMFGELAPKQAEYLEDILSSGRHLLSLINDILDLSKVEAGRMELELGPFDLPAALQDALTLVRERAGRQGIALSLDVDPRLGEVVADERKVKQIALNLLSNAIKFTPAGGWIAVAVTRADGMAEVSVRDTGIGIAPEDHEAIFEEFRQVGGDYAHKREGTGLGLALTKRFVELHGGRIRVESEPGQGSTFTFTIPVGGPWPASSS